MCTHAHAGAVVYPLRVLARCGPQVETLCNANVAIPIIKLQPSSYSKFINELFCRPRGITKTNARAIINVMGSRLEYLVASTLRSRKKKARNPCTPALGTPTSRTRREENANNRVSYRCAVKFHSCHGDRAHSSLSTSHPLREFP